MQDASGYVIHSVSASGRGDFTALVSHKVHHSDLN